MRPMWWFAGWRNTGSVSRYDCKPRAMSELNPNQQQVVEEWGGFENVRLSYMRDEDDWGVRLGYWVRIYGHIAYRPEEVNSVD